MDLQDSNAPNSETFSTMMIIILSSKFDQKIINQTNIVDLIRKLVISAP